MGTTETGGENRTTYAVVVSDESAPRRETLSRRRLVSGGDMKVAELYLDVTNTQRCR